MTPVTSRSLLLLCGILAILVSLVIQWYHFPLREGYLDPEKMLVLQGVGLPEEVKLSKVITNDPNLPSIDGTRASKTAMFMFAFNESGPQCCPSVLSTVNGCVCVTPEQNAFIANRGIVKQSPVLK